MAMALCRTCVLTSASYQACTPSNSVVATIAGAAPCLRTNLAASVSSEPHPGTISSSNRGRFVRGRKLRKIRAEDIKAEQQLYVLEEEDTDAEHPMQIIVPNVDSQLAGEILTEAENTSVAELDESDSLPEREEESKDFWLAEFQKHLPREESWQHVSEYSGLPRYTSRRRALGAPMFMSLLLAFGWSVPVESARAVVPAKIDLTKVPTSNQFDASDQRLRDAVSTFTQALEAPTVRF